MQRRQRAISKSSLDSAKARDASWIREMVSRCGLPHSVLATAVDISQSLLDRPYWVARKNNNLLGVRVACIYHATVINETPKDYKELADITAVPRRSVKNMIAVTQCGHDEVAKRFFRGCGYRSWPAKISVSGMIPRYLSRMGWIEEKTSRRLQCRCLKTAEAVGTSLDNHCPNTILAGIVAYTVWRCEDTTCVLASMFSSGDSATCSDCISSPVKCCDKHVKLLEYELAEKGGVAVATMRQTCEAVRQACDQTASGMCDR
jgi:transcription initiation factor TFIIIB Brf1 subunit/transcription initiation factor TFIIB